MVKIMGERLLRFVQYSADFLRAGSDISAPIGHSARLNLTKILEIPGREEFASDDYLKQFFKENYDIEFPEEDELSNLSEEDKQTLKELKEYLIKEAQKDGKILKDGVFKTMEEFST